MAALITKDKFKLWYQAVRYLIEDSFGFCRSCLILAFRSTKRPGVFSGYCSYWFASQYAKKRTWLWRSWWDQMGKQQGVMPLDSEKLIVCSKLELKTYKKLHIVSKKLKPKKAMKKSYFKTEI